MSSSCFNQSNIHLHHLHLALSCSQSCSVMCFLCCSSGFSQLVLHWFQLVPQWLQLLLWHGLLCCSSASHFALPAPLSLTLALLSPSTTSVVARRSGPRQCFQVFHCQTGFWNGTSTAPQSRTHSRNCITFYQTSQFPSRHIWVCLWGFSAVLAGLQYVTLISVPPGKKYYSELSKRAMHQTYVGVHRANW